MAYTRERKAFATLSHVFSSEEKKDVALRAEYLAALNVAVERYNTAIYENRFVVGGIAERLTVALLCATGTNAQMVGAQRTGADILLEGGSAISVKSQFTKRRSAVRLVNTMGDSATKWEDATFCIIAKYGIGYADPDLLPNTAKSTKDAVVLPWGKLKSFWKSFPRYMIAVPIPEKPDAALSAQSEIASRPITEEILREIKSVYLQKSLPEN